VDSAANSEDAASAVGIAFPFFCSPSLCILGMRANSLMQQKYSKLCGKLAFYLKDTLVNVR
jgi:hypothetical protein